MEESKYKDILEGIVEIIRNAEHSDIGFASICTYMGDHCPELIMNKDEKIRKSLLNEFIHLQSKGYKFADLESKDIITWLENQGKQKPPVIDFKANNWYVSKVDGKIYDMTYNPTDNIEPKFKVGDWIANDYCVGKVIALTDDAYLLDSGQGIPFSCDHNTHLWTACDSEKKEMKSLISNGSDFEPELSHQEVTKKSEQGNMSKMCPRCVQEQKPQGSSIIEIINQGNAKVAADMVESKYKELTHKEVTKKSDKVWSEEDEKILNGIYYTLEGIAPLSYEKELDWLKSIKDKLS